MIITVH